MNTPTIQYNNQRRLWEVRLEDDQPVRRFGRLHAAAQFITRKGGRI